MIEIQIRTDVDAFLGQLDALQRSELPWAVKLALDDTAKQVIAGEQAEMRSVFDQPTDWTLGGLRWSPAEKGGKGAQVYFDEFGGGGTPAGIYLQPQIKGGPRRATPFESRLIRMGLLKGGEFLVPAGHADRDGRGNLNPGQLTKILSDLGGLAGIADKGPGARNRGVRRAEQYTFERTRRLPVGVYLNQGRRKLLVFLVVRQPSYRAIYNFQGVAETVIQRDFAANFRQRLAYAVATSRNNPNRMQRVA